MSIGLIVAFGLAAACGAPAQTSAAPTQAPPTQSTAPATAPPTAAATQIPTDAPTEPAPTAEPTATAPTAKVIFSWAPGSVKPADADDVDEIVRDLVRHEGILSGHGNETVLNITYDPTVVTVEEIMDALKKIGHPVLINE